MAVHGDRPPGAGGRTGGAADELGVRATTPVTDGFSVGDMINVAGQLLALVDDDTDANVLRGVAADGSDDYRGANAASGGANNFGSFTDPAYQGEVSWYTVGGGGSPSWRIRLPDSALGGSPPATIYARIVAADRQTTDAVLTRDQPRDSTSLTAYAAGNTDPRGEIPVGMAFTAYLWTVSLDGTPLKVHAVDRWEEYHALSSEAPTSSGGQGQQSPGASDGFSRGPTAPDSPAEGAIWSDTTADELKRYDGSTWETLATRADVDAGDAVLNAALDGALTRAVRRAQWARAWIRAADQTAALAGVAAATWTNQGAGTVPTGAYWDIGAVPAGSDPLWELTALVTPTAGSSDAWTFGAWAALQITATNTQYSTDGSTSWHAVRAGADRYERHRMVGGGWGAAIPLYAADELVWTTLFQADIVHQTVNWLPEILIDLPSTVRLHSFALMRIRLETVVGGGRVLAGDCVFDPDIFVADAYANRAAVPVDLNFVWQLRLNAQGLGVLMGNLPHTTGAYADGANGGLSLVWIRPNAVSSATDAAHLRVIYLSNRGVTFRMRVEVI